MCKSRIERALTALVLVGAATALTACSEFYFERRDGISIVSGDAIAVDKVTHTIDPWPPSSANRNIHYEGEKMAGAAERYRQNRVTPPINATTSSVAYTQAQQAAAGAANAMSSAGGGGAKP